MKSEKIDRTFLISFLILALSGFVIFSSASLGLLAREGATYASVAFKQAFTEFFLGTIFLIATYKISYKFWRKHAFIILIATLVLTVLVFVPHIGFAHGGARRWLNLGPLSLQPSEFLKFGLVVYFAAWLSGMKDKIRSYKYGFVPFVVLLGISGGLMLLQPDTGTFLVMFASLIGVYVAAGARWRDLGLLFLICIVGAAGLFFWKPYIKGRVLTFLDPARDPQGAGYQIQQSQIAIGSGRIFGRGFGQSIQKFDYLPEPIGDSIFAVAGEEFGFAGSVLLILLLLFFTARGLKIASGVPDAFGRLLGVGIVILIVSQSFINIASMLGVLPLTGVPLVFVSHGGTAILIAMAEMGVLLQLSKKSTG